MSSSTITETIRHDLRTRIRTERPLSIPLSLPRLAHHYKVSLTPVRIAVNDLVDEGWLIKTPQGRIEVNPDGRIHDEISVEVSDEIDDAGSLQVRLTEEIVRRSLQGDAGYLREEAMAQQMGVGRTALRQAFSRLAGQGFLEHVPRCGWRARTFSEEDMNAYLVARESLELAALEAAEPNLRAEDLQAMLDGNADGENALNNDLHGYLIEKSGNPYIKDFFTRNGPYWAALFDVAAPETHVLDEMAHQHRIILKALLEQDWTRAAEMLKQHIRAQRPIVREWMMELSTSEQGGKS